MRKIIMYCDRCKRSFEKWDFKHAEKIGVGDILHDDNEPYIDTQKDLCESCYTELEKWWNYENKCCINCKFVFNDSTTGCIECSNDDYGEWVQQESNAYCNPYYDYCENFVRKDKENEI